MRRFSTLHALIGAVTFGVLPVGWCPSPRLGTDQGQRDLTVLSTGAQLSSSQAGLVGGVNEASSCTLSLFQQRSAPTGASGDIHPLPNEVRQELATQRRKWQTQQPAFYRLCVITLNPLLHTVREVDVEHGRVRVARGAQGMDALAGRPDARGWSPNAGVTVEDLFNEIQRGLNPTAAPARRDGIRFVLVATYDSELGYPTRLHSGPDPTSGGRVYDADVETLISVTPLPTGLLEPVSPGEVYITGKRGRILRPLAAYTTLLGFLSAEHDDRIRALWPSFAADILKRGNAGYWRQVNWEPRQDMVGRVLGTFKHASGQSVYLMAISHNGEDLYLPIATDAVDVNE